MADPYRVLELQPGASQAEIKRAYRRLAKSLHPDSAGERSLPAFLEVQEAYEQLAGGRAAATGRSRSSTASAGSTTWSRSGGARPGWQEPWRADPERARAAREQARNRRAAPGAAGTGTRAEEPRAWAGDGLASDDSGSRAGPRTGTGGRAGRATGSRGASDSSGSRGASTGGGPDTTGPSGAGPGGGPRSRRRSTRKATMGSTSYDEAREATDPRWAGASWYGPTTGEYWIVNPREYADPRKHGPGYSGRARSGLRPDEVDVRPGPATDGLGSAATTAEHRGPADDGAGPDARVRSAGASVPPAAGPPAEPAWNPGARAYAGSASAHAPTSQVEPDQEPTLERTLRSLVAGLFGANPVDPVHRVALALVAWPPIGIAAASTIGQLTGCASYAVTCGGTDPILPWLAQAVVVGLLLLATPLARLLAAGTLGLVAGLLPAMAVLIAFGGARSGTAGPALAAIVAVAWLIGAAWGIRTGIWRGAATAGPPRGSS